jgi:hypothetical protein
MSTNHAVKLLANKPLEIKLTYPFQINHSTFVFSYIDQTAERDIIVRLFPATRHFSIAKNYYKKSPSLIVLKEYEDKSNLFLNDEEYNILEITSNVDVEFTVFENCHIPAETIEEYRKTLELENFNYEKSK